LLDSKRPAKDSNNDDNDNDTDTNNDNENDNDNENVVRNMTGGPTLLPTFHSLFGMPTLNPEPNPGNPVPIPL